MSYPATAHISLDAVAANTRVLAAHTGKAQVMAVVKADAYGHGLVPVAKTVLQHGASWLGVAQTDEALALRIAGIDAPILAWIFTPHTSLTELVASNIDLSASAPWAIEAINAAAVRTKKRARVHLKVDTGLARGGARHGAEFAQLLAAAQVAPRIDVVGCWSHFALADDPGHSTIGHQVEVFTDTLAVVSRAGIELELRHIANSAATLTMPDFAFDLVRPGIGIYGISPIAGETFGLTPAMTLTAHLSNVKRVPAGQGVSYGLTWTAPRDTYLGLVPLGYADGIPRHCSNKAQVQVGGYRAPIAGRVCMDQFVVDLGANAQAQPGDLVTIFGPGTAGEPTATQWAQAADTINYEIVTRLGGRVPRQYLGG